MDESKYVSVKNEKRIIFMLWNIIRSIYQVIQDRAYGDYQLNRRWQNILQIIKCVQIKYSF